MVQSLPGFLNLSLNVCSPCQVLGDVYTEVLEAAHPLHRGPTDHKRGVGPLLSLPEVYNQLFSFAHVQRETVVLAPWWWSEPLWLTWDPPVDSPEYLNFTQRLLSNARILITAEGLVTQSLNAFVLQNSLEISYGWLWRGLVLKNHIKVIVCLYELASRGDSIFTSYLLKKAVLKYWGSEHCVWRS